MLCFEVSSIFTATLLTFHLLLVESSSLERKKLDSKNFLVNEKRKSSDKIILKLLQTQSRFQCAHRCKLEDGCFDINYNLKSKACELLSRNDVVSAMQQPQNVSNQSGWMHASLIQAHNQYYCKGKGFCRPALSCKQIKEFCGGCKSGFYLLHISGEFITGFCDMETSSGGWTMVGNVSVTNENDRFNKYLGKVQSSNIRSLMSNVSTGAYVLSVPALRQLKEMTGFTEIRIKYYKPWHGRLFDAIFKPPKVLDMMLAEVGNQFASCHDSSEVEFLSGDTSLLATLDCFQISWTGFHNVLYNHAIWAYSLYHVQIDLPNRMECDDYPAQYGGSQRYTGWWQYYAR